MDNKLSDKTARECCYCGGQGWFAVTMPNIYTGEAEQEQQQCCCNEVFEKAKAELEGKQNGQ